MNKEESTIDDFVWPNRYMLTIIGFWPLKPDATLLYRLFAYFRTFLSILAIVSVFVPEVLTVAIFWGNVSIMADIGSMAITGVQLLFKLLYTLVYHREFSAMYAKTEEMWIVTDDKRERHSFEGLANTAKQLTIGFLIAGISNAVTFICAPIGFWIYNRYHSNETDYHRDLPFDVWYGFDTEHTPNYEIMFSLQSVAIILGVASVVSYDATFMTLVLHVCGQFRLICTRFHIVGNKIRERDYSDVSVEPRMMILKNIKHHQLMISFAVEMNRLLGPVIFVQLMTSALQICLTGYALLATIGWNTEALRFISFMLSVFTELGIWCWPGEFLIQESSAVSDAICYDIPWYLFTTSQQRELGFMLLRTQKECKVTALGFQTLSIEKITEVFSTAASYFTLLRSINENEGK